MANKEMNPKLTIEQRDEIKKKATTLYIKEDWWPFEDFLNDNTEESKPMILMRACPECGADMEEGLYNQWECMNCRYAEVAE